MVKAFFIPPVFAAAVFVLPQSYHWMHRPDMIYIPLVFELFFFCAAYIVYGIINGVIIFPLCMGVSFFTPHPLAGLVLAFAAGASASFIVHILGLFGTKPLLDQAHVFVVFLPILASTGATFYYLRHGTPRDE